MIIKCPQCHEEIEVEQDWVGRKAKCPYCETKFVIGQVNVQFGSKVSYLRLIREDVWMQVLSDHGSLPIPLGIDENNCPVIEDLSNVSSLAIVGSDTYDQGNMLCQILGGWLYFRTPEAIELVLVDGDGGNNLTMSAFSRFPHVVKYIRGRSGESQSPTTEFDRDLDKLLVRLRQELQMRRNIMRLSGCSSFSQYALKYQTARRVYVFFDSPGRSSYLRVCLRKLFADSMCDVGMHVIMSATCPPQESIDVYRPLLASSAPGVRVGCLSFRCPDVQTSVRQFGGPEASNPGFVFYRIPEKVIAVACGLDDPGYELTRMLEAKWPVGSRSGLRASSGQGEKLKTVERTTAEDVLAAKPTSDSNQLPASDNRSLIASLCDDCSAATREGRSVFWASSLLFGAIACVAYVYGLWYVSVPLVLLAMPVASVLGKRCFARYRTDVTGLGVVSVDNQVWQLLDEACRKQTRYRVSWSDKFVNEDYPNVTRQAHGRICPFVQEMPRCLSTRNDVPSYDLGSGSVVLLQDVAVFVGGFYPTMCVLPYSGISIQKKWAYVRRWSNPGDGSVVNVAWEHSRVDGGRDRRYKSNCADYLCSYNLLFYEAQAAGCGIVVRGGILVSEK